MAVSHGGFVVTGTRPPSACSLYRPNSAQSGHHGYHTLKHSSTVDESLFGTQHPTKLNEAIPSFKAPWEYPKPAPPRHTFGAVENKLKTKPKFRGRPLLWSPAPSESTHIVREQKRPKSSLNDSSLLWNTRDHFRHLKHTPSFVDESLFGSRLAEPTFEAPWNERKKGEKKPSKPYLWDPFDGTKMPTQNGADVEGVVNGHGALKRPNTALGISRSRSKSVSSSTGQRPVWKP